MDERKSNIPRPSALPRLASKLPMPKPSNIRSYASRETLVDPADLQLPKLRTQPSRDRLGGSAAVPAIRKKASVDSFRTRPQQSTRPILATSQYSSNQPKTIKSDHNATKLPYTATQSRRRPSDAGVSARPSFGAPSLSRKSSMQLLAARSTGYGGEQDVLSQSVTAAGPDAAKARSAKPRPSLSDRTIETLSQLPSSPALSKRPSAFFDPHPGSRPGSRDSRPGSRPGSSHRPESSLRSWSRSQSRPGSSSAQEDPGFGFRASTNTYKPPTPVEESPIRKSVGSLPQFKTPARPAARSTQRSASNRYESPALETLYQSRSSPSPEKRGPPLSYGAKTIAGPRTVKSRPSLNGLFRKPSMPTLKQSTAPTAPSQVPSRNASPPRLPPARASQLVPRAHPSSRKGSITSHRSSVSNEEAVTSGASTASTALTVDSSPPAAASRKSSAALRETIAKARAARRAASEPQQASSPSPVAADGEEVSVIPTDTTFDFGLAQDPFGQHKDDGSHAKIIHSRVSAARTSGRLNIAAMELREIPSQVLNMYELESVGKSDGSWAESVDLTRFVAADNEIEMIEESIFPDTDPSEMDDSEDSKGNIFAGLETLDLHGNMLICLPMGLRRLHQLTSLNMSHNRITNNALEVISQITSLRDLKLGGNLFYGPLDPCFTNLENLESADLHGNNISALPLNIEKMSKLRILNISENSFESVLFEPLSKLPLTELSVRKNKLSGVLIEDAVDSFPSLITLDVSSNQITHVVSEERSDPLKLPALQQILLSMNRLQVLPDVSSWQSMVTLTADENQISEVPRGFVGLEKLRHADLSSNDIRAIPAEVGLMDNLAMFRLSGNPLKDKKFSTATTEELKNTLAARLQPAITEEPPSILDVLAAASSAHVAPSVQTHPSSPKDDFPAMPPARKPVEPADDYGSDMDDDFATPPTSAPPSPARSRATTLSNQVWPIKSGGVLDRSETQISALHPVVASKVARDHKVREVLLQRNLFNAFPDSLSFFAETLTVLSLANNQLLGENYIGGPSGTEDLELPALKELILATNHITGLVPLTKHLHAPNLQKLDVSFNRVSTLPPGDALKAAFPELVILLLSNNHLSDLDPESIKGMRIVDVMNNDIAHLNPRLGLLGGSGTSGVVLEKLEVTGNRFRVPRWNVLERGTEATLRWLRGRVPVAEMAAWKGRSSGSEGEGSFGEGGSP